MIIPVYLPPQCRSQQPPTNIIVIDSRQRSKRVVQCVVVWYPSIEGLCVASDGCVVMVVIVVKVVEGAVIVDA